MLEKIIIFGIGQLAQLLHEYIQDDGQFEIVAFTADNPEVNTLFGLPVVEFNELEKQYAPSDYKILIVIGYSERNQKRRKVFERVKNKGYSMVNYIHRSSIVPKSTIMGENCIILENNVFQPHVTIGDDMGMLSSNVVSHHVQIEDHCFLTEHVCVGGRVKIGTGSTLGLNSTIKQRVIISPNTFVGANVYLRSDSSKNSVYEAPEPKIISSGYDEV